MKSAFQLILLGFLFHLVYIFSIFDIYFTSPLVHGMTPYRLEPTVAPKVHENSEAPVENLEAPAKRLFLLVGDGLRADTLFDDQGVKLAPHIHNLIRTKASFGVSHTRVPTESRPGHVAIIAGFYEDVSAVTKGWKLNPITFDSLFNQSSKTFAFGSPDILPMFQLGASDHNRVNISMYSHEDENFAKDPRWLDDWVFNRVNEMFDKAEKDAELNNLLRSDGTIIFLHLLGLDTAGHSTWPGKPEYRGVLANLDKGLSQLESRIEKFYKDNRTSFILTADHGMGNQGSHGDGHPDNTRTPLVAWGAGIAGPEYSPMQGHDSFTGNWEINQFARKDVNQADIAPLMSSLLGISYPMNSVGILPLSYLKTSDSFKASSALVNAKQVVAQYQVKNELKKNNEIFFKPFKSFQGPDADPDSQISHISRLISSGKFDDAEKSSVELIETTLQGLRYLQTYDWLFLRTIVSSGYVGWILHCIIFILYISQNEKANTSKTPLWVPFLTYGIGTMTMIVLILQHAPWKYYLYVSFPVYFWNRVLTRGSVLIQVISHSWYYGDKLKIILGLGLSILSLELLVVSYFYREILALGLLSVAFWPWIEAPKSLWQHEWKLFLRWSIICLVAAAFPLLAVEKEENLALNAFGGLIVLIIGSMALVYAPDLSFSKMRGISLRDKISQQEIYNIRITTLIQLSMVLISIIQMWVSGNCLQSRQVVPFHWHFIGWLVIVGSVGYLMHITSNDDHYIRRLISIFLAFAPTYIILSISYEVLFYVIYFIILLTWIQLERSLYESSDLSKSVQKQKSKTRSLGLIDVRSAILFLFFLNLGFFGTGNIASVSSFSLQAVFRLTLEFDAILMGSLLVVKILTPYFLLVSHFAFAGVIVDLQPITPFLVVLATTDVMTLNFFFLVKDEGSWLEIGTSISHFAIGSLFSLFISLMYLTAHWLTRRSIHKITPEKKLE